MCLKSVTELSCYVGLLETLVFTCVINPGLIESLLPGKKNLQNLAAVRVLRAKNSCTKAATEQCSKCGQRGIFGLKSHIPCVHVKLEHNFLNFNLYCQMQIKKNNNKRISYIRKHLFAVYCSDFTLLDHGPHCDMMTRCQR